MKLIKFPLVLGIVCGMSISETATAVETINTSCGMVTTSVMPSGDRNDAGNANFSSVIGFDYDLRGEKSNTADPLQLASAPEVGTVWGKAYNANTKKLYVAAFLRRHADIAPDGLGAIYEIDVSDTSSNATIGTPTLWMDVNNNTALGAGATLFPSETAANRELGSPFAPSHDVWAFTRVGKQGLGGLELSDDYSTLYAMDLTNRQLLVIDMATKTVTARHAITDPGCAGGAGDVRPFGVDYLNGKVYVGVSCSGETNQSDNDVDTYVMKLSGNSFSTVVSSAKGYRWSSYWSNHPYIDPSRSCGSQPKKNNYTPVVTNMELDSSGNMLIGVTGVNGWRFASQNYVADPGCNDLVTYHESRGFVLHATPDGSGNWVLDSSEEYNTGAYTHRYKTGEFAHWAGGTGSSATFTGGMSISDCSGQEVALVNLMDPLSTESGGTRWMRTADAEQEAATNAGDGLAGDKPTSIASTLEHYKGIGNTWEKSSGLGDIEYLRAASSNPATGNLTITKVVTGGNDPQSFSLQLDCSDNNFDDATISLAAGASHTVNNIPSGTNCSVTETLPTAPVGYSYGAAVIAPSSVVIGDGTTVTITVTNPLSANGNPNVDLAINKTANPTSAVSGDTVTYTIIVINNGPDDATGVEVKDQLPVGVTYANNFTATQGNYDAGTGIWTVGTLANTATATLTIDVTVD